MSRAEEKALEAYPIKKEWIGNQYGVYGDVNEDSREKFIQGYEQAEKDNADLIKLADAMYYTAQSLTTDASRLHKAMEAYRQYRIQNK